MATPKAPKAKQKTKYEPPTVWDIPEVVTLTIPIEDGLTDDGEPNVVPLDVSLREPSLAELERAGRFGAAAVGELIGAAIVDRERLPGRYMIPVMQAVAEHFTMARRHSLTDGESGTDDPMKEILDLARTG